MKVIISGPRRAVTERITSDDILEFSWMHIELELEELPKRGDIIILNNGSSYYVTNIMWWIDGPQNDAYWSRTEDYRVEGRYQTVNISVEPDNRRDRYGYPAGLEDGKKQGGEEFLEELRGLVDLAVSAQIDGARLIGTWLEKQERVTAERKATEQAMQQKANEILATLQARKEGKDG